MNIGKETGEHPLFRVITAHVAALEMMKPEDIEALERYLGVREMVEIDEPDTVEAQEAFDRDTLERVPGSKNAMDIYTNLVDAIYTAGNDS